MEDKEHIHSCFETLISCLYEIRYNCKNRIITPKEYVVKDAIDKGLLGYEPEDIQDKCNSFKEEIKELQNDIETILSNVEFVKAGYCKNPFIPQVDDDAPKFMSAEQVKSSFIEYTRSELEYYLNELEKIVEESNKRIGFISLKEQRLKKKIKLNLTKAEIYSLFALLFDEDVNYIDKKYDDGSELTKVGLARFISNNFSAKNNKSISTRNAQNNLDAKNIKTLNLKSIIQKLNSRLNSL